MSFGPLPAAAAWRHLDSRTGFEVAYVREDGDGWRIEGCTTAVEDGQPWVVDYEIRLGGNWRTRTARVTKRSSEGSRATVLDADGQGRWKLNGESAAQLDGCLDVDLESSALTNAFPIHRLLLPQGKGASAPAAYVRIDLSVGRLEQDYLHASDEGARQRYGYTAPEFDFACSLLYDESGLVLDYPGIAIRAM
jgi:hypothetical protein